MAAGQTGTGALSAEITKPFQEVDWEATDAAALERRLIAELIGLESVLCYFPCPSAAHTLC